jgi:hypothetical protein
MSKDSARQAINLIGVKAFLHANGTLIESGDYSGFRLDCEDEPRRFFLKLRPSDLDVDALEITQHVNGGLFIVEDAKK